MKQIIMITGPMGVGKTTIGRLLNQSIDKSVHLEGDNLLGMNPFVGNMQVEDMTCDNVSYVINNFLKSPHINTIIFSWLMTDRRLEQIKEKINKVDTTITEIVLTVSKSELQKRWDDDEINHWHSDVKSLKTYDSIEYFSKLDYPSINTDEKSKNEITEEIISKIK